MTLDRTQRVRIGAAFAAVAAIAGASGYYLSESHTPATADGATGGGRKVLS